MSTMQLMAQFSLSRAVAFALASSAAIAEDTAKSGKTLTPQQQRMVDCNKQASGMSGDERKTFMSSCLKAAAAASPAPVADTATATASTAKMTREEKKKSCGA